MPIRMEDDPIDPQDSSGGGNSGGGGSGGGGGLFQLLPLLLMLFRGPKIILLIAIVVGGYFFFGRSCNSSVIQNVAQLATGGVLDPRQFDKAKVYESLSDDDIKNPLPESANLNKYAPAV